MKRRMKKKALLFIILILILIILLISIFLLYTNNNKFKIKNIGYNSIEAEKILKLNDTEINKIIKYNYNENILYVIKSDNYDSKKLDLYLKYINENKDINYLKIFNLINHKDVDINKIDEYINLLKEYDNLEAIIMYINNYKALNIDLTPTTLSFMTEKYFIIDYLDRYLKYYENHKDLNYSEIITRINSNLDYKFYEDSNPADLSKGMYTLVNKYNYLDYNYVPEDLEKVSYEYTMHDTKLNKVALENFIKMDEDAKKDNVHFIITTAYRDYNFQSVLYNNYVRADGVANADTYSARPGYSEHQFGYSFDLSNTNYASFNEFEYTDEYKWLNENAYKYGFIMRYPKGKEYITGYQFESWHYRYVGIDIATYIYENDITYEEYYAYFLR